VFGHFSHDSTLGKKYNWSIGQVVKVIPENGRQPDGWILSSPWEVYKVSFNGCDVFNKELRRFRWPFLRFAHNGLAAEGNISDFIEAVTLENTFNAWCSLKRANEETIAYDFLIELSNEPYSLAIKC
jgi:hypothetical protein